MAIDRIYLAQDLSEPEKWYYGTRIKAGQTAPSTMYVTWHTAQYMPDGEHMCHASFVIKTRWAGIAKGADPVYGEYPTTFEETELSAADCLHETDGSGAIWKCDLASVLPSSPPYRLNDSWDFADRLYDEFKVEFAIYAKYDTENYPWGSASPSSSQTLFIGYFPDYRITSVARSGTDNIIIGYEAEGWTRADDRYELAAFSADGETLVNSHWAKSSWTVGEVGYISIPALNFIRTPNVGEQVFVSIRWNAVYKPPSLDFAEDSGTFTVGGGSDAEAIAAEFEQSGGGIMVLFDVADYTEVSASLVGDRWSFDMAAAEMTGTGTSALLAFPPLGVDFTVSAIGHKTITESGVVRDVYSEPITSTMRIDPGRCYWVDPIDPSTGEPLGYPTIKAMFGIKWTVSESPEMDIKKFSGRPSPSALYGYGKTRQISLEFDILPIQVGDASDFSAVFQLHESQVAVFRSPYGERYVAAIDSVKHTRAYNSKWVHVAISAEEVAL